MRKGFSFIPLILLFLALPAYAAFDTSHHDLRTYVATASPTQGCFHCHGRIVTVSIDNTNAGYSGSVGALCLGRCHAMVGIFSGADPAALQPQAPGYPSDNGTFQWNAPGPNWQTVLFGGTAGSANGSHGKDKALAGTNRSGFPYDGSGSTGFIECTSCHAVHDDSNTPFIWRQMSTPAANHTGTAAPAASATTTGLCDTCHADKANVGGNLSANVPGGNHPVDIVVDTAAAAARSTSTASTFRTVRHGRAISIDGPTTYGTGHRVWDVAAPTQAAMRSAANVTNSWPLGGKMWAGANTYSNFTSGTSQLGCGTCHSAHQSASSLSNLVNAQLQDITTGHGYNPICVGCHGTQTDWALDKGTWNVGSGSYGHPVGDNTNGVTGSGRNTYITSVGGFTFDVNTATGVAWQAGANGRILCSSCHDVHNAVAGSMAIRNLGQTTTAVICKQCHNGIGLANVVDVSKGGTATAVSGVAEGPNVHHRTATAVTIGEHTPSGETAMTIAAPSWGSTAPLGLGVIAGGMDCADCHVFNGTAHNW